MRLAPAVLALALLAPTFAAAEEGDQIQATKLSKVPKQKKFLTADYPPEAQAKGVEADVILLLDIDEKGFVTAVGVQQPAEPPGLGFDEAAMVAAQGWEFEPAELDGKPIAVQITYRYRFTLTAAAASQPTSLPTSQPTSQPSSQPAGPPLPANVNFTGRLLERGTRRLLPGVVVTVFRDDVQPPVGYEAVSDDAARFNFFDLPPGEWKVLVEPPGFYPYRTTETIVAGERLEATYYVEKGSYNPYDVTVTAARPKKEVSRTILSAKEIDKVPGGAGDPLTVVQNFAGVARVAQPGQFAVRGSAPEDTLIFIDGIEVPLIYHFGGLKSVLPIGMLESIEFYPGNFAPSYGRATGGIIDVRIKDLKPEKVGGYADVSLLDTGVYLETPVGKHGAVAFAGRRSYLDVILRAAIPDSAGVTLKTAPRYYDMQLLGTWRPKPAHSLRLFAFGSDDKLALLFDNPADLDPTFDGNDISNATSFYRGIFEWRYVPSTKFENSLKVAAGTDSFVLKAGKLGFDLQLMTTQVRDLVRFELTPRVAISGGLDVQAGIADVFVRLPRPPKEGQPMTNFDLQETITAENKGELGFSPAAFVEVEVEPTPGLTILPGARVDYFDLTGQTVLQPRLTTRWTLSPLVTAKAGAGLFAQEPTFEEVDEDFGNPGLDAERAWHFSAGAEYKVRPWLTLDATAFYKLMDSLVSPTDEVIVGADGAVRPKVYDNGGEGRVIGLELQARHDFSHNLTGFLAYTLSRAERKDSGSDDYRLFDFDQTHILTVVAAYVLPRNWQIGARLRMISGNPNTPVVGSVYDAGADRYDPVYGATNTARDAFFHQLDVRIDKRWIFQSWNLNAYIDIQNIYNKQNAEGREYNFDYSESKAGGDIPILPILGLRGEF